MATRFIRLRIEGTIPGGEVWSVNPVYALPAAAPNDIDYAGAQERATACSNVVVPTTLTDAMGGTANTKITSFSVEARTNDGTLQVSASALKTIPGTGSTNAHPAQTAMVCSLRSNSPGGRGRGRLYWPAIGRSLDSATLRWPSGTQAAILAGFNTYLGGLQDALNIDEIPDLTEFKLSVWSRTGNAFHNITRLQLGDVPDTQRRRRDAMAENYTTSDYSG